MNHWIHHGILLAQSGRWEGMSRRFRGRNTRIDLNDVLIGLLILGGVVAVLWALSLVIRLQEHRQAYTSPLRLFWSLCKAHQLRWSQCWLLWRVVRTRRMQDPAQLFLRPELLNPAGLGRSFRLRMAELKSLRALLFVEPKEDEPERNRPASTPPGESSAAVAAAAPPTPTGGSPTLEVPPWPPSSGFDAGASADSST